MHIDDFCKHLDDGTLDQHVQKTESEIRLLKAESDSALRSLQSKSSWMLIPLVVLCLGLAASLLYVLVALFDSWTRMF